MKSVDMQELIEVMKGSPKIVDVRESYEYQEGHIPMAINIPLSELETRYSEIENGTYIICRSGARSASACQFLATKGIQVTNVSGGTLAWNGCLVEEIKD